MNIHRFPVVSIVALIVFESLTASANAAGMIAYTNFTREGLVGDLGGVLSNIVSYGWDYSDGSAVPSSVERPNGESDWSTEFSNGNRQTFSEFLYGPMAPLDQVNGAPFADVTEAADWMDENADGQWTVNYGSSTYTFDTSSGYKKVLSEQHFMELTAESSQQFLDLRSSGSTGVFRFDLSTSSPDLSNSRYELDSGSDFFGGLILSNSGANYFELSIDTPLAADATLALRFIEGTVVEPLPDNEASINLQSSVLYGYTYAIPEPSMSLFVGVFGAGWVVLCFSRRRARRRT